MTPHTYRLTAAYKLRSAIRIILSAHWFSRGAMSSRQGCDELQIFVIVNDQIYRISGPRNGRTNKPETFSTKPFSTAVTFIENDSP